MKKFVPEPIKRVGRAGIMFFIKLLKVYSVSYKVYLAGYRADVALLMENRFQYEALFKDSEKNFEAIVASRLSEFKWFIGTVYNVFFEPVDIELLYSVIRQYKPSLIIEIGSGHSTFFAMDAIKKNKAGHIISIDPQPYRRLPIQVEHIQSKVEDVDINIFKKLAVNDVLFIDSSHTAEEARYHVKKILPTLKKGVIVHHHDILYPYAIYYKNDPAMFGEPDVVLDFYCRNTELYEIIVCASYVRYKNLELIRRLIKSYSWNPTRIPSSLWARKIK